MCAEQTSRAGGAEGRGSDGDFLAEAAEADRDGQAFKALRSVKKLAEVKRVFDRFAVDGMLTAYEALQALTEAGCTAPRTHAGRYLRSRRFFGLRREVNTGAQRGTEGVRTLFTLAVGPRSFECASIEFFVETLERCLATNRSVP